MDDDLVFSIQDLDALTDEDIQEAAWQTAELCGYVISPMLLMWIQKHLKEVVVPRLVRELENNAQ